MRIISWDAFRTAGVSSLFAAVIGVFDGLHIGHRELIRRVLGRPALASTVFTFQANPKRILSRSGFRGELSTLDQKLALIDSMNVDICVLIDFSGEFSKLPGRQFLSLLSASGALRYLAVGGDFRCGYGLDTDSQGIREFCRERSIDAEILDAILWAGHPVSSSRIRKAIAAGHVEEAAHMLGRLYEIDLRGATESASKLIVPRGGQSSPPPGRYESQASYGDHVSGTFVAELDTEGRWRLAPEICSAGSADCPIGLRLVRMVSRDVEGDIEDGVDQRGQGPGRA